MKIELLTSKEFKQLIYQGKNLPNKNYANDLDKIRYFSFDDIIGINWFGNDKYTESLRFVVAYDNNHIYGVLKFAYFSCPNHYSISYCSVNESFFNMGICKKMVSVFCEYFSITYPNTELNISQYSVSGWKYLRPTILSECSKHNITFIDNIIGYFDKGKEYDPEYYSLKEVSIKEVGRSEFY